MYQCHKLLLVDKTLQNICKTLQNPTTHLFPAVPTPNREDAPNTCTQPSTPACPLYSFYAGNNNRCSVHPSPFPLSSLLYTLPSLPPLLTITVVSNYVTTRRYYYSLAFCFGVATVSLPSLHKVELRISFRLPVSYLYLFDFDFIVVYHFGV
jgi:hypothetical protein